MKREQFFLSLLGIAALGLLGKHGTSSLEAERSYQEYLDRCAASRVWIFNDDGTKKLKPAIEMKHWDLIQIVHPDGTFYQHNKSTIFIVRKHSVWCQHRLKEFEPEMVTFRRAIRHRDKLMSMECV